MSKRTSQALYDHHELESKRARGEQEGALPPLQIVPKGLELPSGWTECPNMGHRMNMLRLVPTKVPLGRKFRPVVTEDQHFSPERLVQDLRAKGCEVGLIIDLTNSWRYYDLEEVTDLGVAHLKIRCRGRGEAPEPEAVNQFVWDLFSYLMQNPDKWVVVHCTHGFNRTGFMIVSMLMRMEGMFLAEALHVFKEHRPAGIYKDDYIRALYKYYHETLPHNYEAPALPVWKPEEADSPGIDHELDAEENGHAEEAEPQGLQHDDDIGEEVPFSEAQMICDSIVRQVWLRRSTFCHNYYPSHACPLLHDDFGKEATLSEAQMICDVIARQVRQMAPDDYLPENWINFPGSQPVSLDRQNMTRLQHERYRVTWKADGTRYMLMMLKWGTYLVDRSLKVRRVQMRFPVKPMKGKHSFPHHQTLLDGELIVDEDRDTGKHLYRYLAYDIMAINNKSVAHHPWKDRWQWVEELSMQWQADEHTRDGEARWQWLEEFVMQRRADERKLIDQARAGLTKYPVHYEYQAEPFGIRRKDFWPLWKAKSILQSFIPTLSHESDGLIFQACNEPYIVGTDEKLLKWKYGSMNSVDFLLRSKAAGPELYLGQGSDVLLLPGAKVEFAEGEDVRRYENSIVECSWDGEEGVWRFMRVRTDKQRPNAKHVYEKVMSSIEDNIEEDDIIAEVAEAMKSSIYDKDRLGSLQGQ